MEEKRSDRRQSGSFFLAGNFGLCSETVGVLAWRYEHRIRRREDLLFSFGSERGPFPKEGPGHLLIWVVARPFAPLGASPLDAPGSTILEDWNPFRQHFFAAPAWIIRLVCFLLSCPCVDLDKHSFFCRFTGTVCTRGTDTFSVLAHSFSPFVSHFDTHFYTSVTAPCSAGLGKHTVHICMQKPRSQSS